MERSFGLRCCIPAALSIMLSLCLVCGLVPIAAFAADAPVVSQERPTQITQEVALGDSISDEPASGDGVEQSGSFDQASNADKSDMSDQPSVSDQASNTQPTAPQTSVDVSLSGDPAATKTLLVDGLEYVIDTSSQTATLVGWYGAAPAGDLSVPTQVADGGFAYSVVALGETDDPAISTINEPSNKPSDASRNSAGGGPYLMPQNFSL